MAKNANKSAGAATRERPQAVMFDGKTLPPGADEDWWGAPQGSDDPELKTLNVPFRSNNQPLGAFTTRSAKPGDMVTVFPAEGVEGEASYRRAYGIVGDDGPGLPPDDEALTGEDKQTEYMKEAHKVAHGLERDPNPGVTVHGPAEPSRYPPGHNPAPVENAAADTPENRKAARERAQREGETK